jgi:hypothetical protein
MPSFERPVNKCKWATYKSRNRNNGQNMILHDCVNYNKKFCLHSKFPWFRYGKFRRYPARYEVREHCVRVWNNRAKEFAYDPDEEGELSDSEEEEEKCDRMMMGRRWRCVQ